MASFLRGKQAGMQNDLSANILPGLFAPDERSRYGINSQISCVAYDPVQSLLAVGTNESRFGSGKIYVFGQSRVQKFLVPSRSRSFADIHFCANRLISLDSQNEVTIWDLDAGARLTSFQAPGIVACMLTDPMLDWCFIGLQTGEIYAYDLDRERLSQFRLPNFWTDRDPRARAVTIVSLQLHPRDVGKLLIGYSHGAVIYSFKQNQATRFFEYQIPSGAPGGSHQAVDTLRKPKLTHALWHPTGTFVLTAHDDASLVFWDTSNDGRLVMARTLYDFNIDQPLPRSEESAPKHPYSKIAWCCKQNPEDSALLVAGGQTLDGPPSGLTFIELGVTPNYATSSWQILADYVKGKKRATIETPAGAEVVNFFLIPRASPYFSGAQDPIAILALLSSGEIITMSFPSGYPISPTNQLHPSLSFVHPFATKIASSTLSRDKWLGMVENRPAGEPILKGGAEAIRSRRRFEGRTIIQVAYADSTVRIWDVGHGDEIENPKQLQIDVARALNRFEDVTITAMSMAAESSEFAVGTSKGEVVIYRWDTNKFYGQAANQELPSNPGGLSDIRARSEPNLKSGLQPLSLYEMMQGPISAVKVSDVGFVAVGSENGFLSIIDLRGPSVMFQSSIADLTKSEKKSSFLKSRSSVSTNKDWPMVIEFAVMTLDDDKYSSICCFIGTKLGKVITLRILPSGPSFKAEPAGIATLSDEVVSICPIIADTGKPAAATGHAVAGLREGRHVNGLLVVVTQTEVRIFKPATAKGASKSFSDCLCSSAAVTEFELHGMALVGVFGDRQTRAFSLPGLKEIGNAPLPMIDGARIANSLVTEDGEVICWTGPSELAVLQVWGTGQALENAADRLINPDLTIPPRPTISNMQWISGTQYISPADLDLLIGGPGRPPSKRMLAASEAMEHQARAGPSSPSQEGWGDYLTRQLNERTEKLNIMNDSIDNIAASSQKWSEDASKFVSSQKRKMFLGSITSKFS
ncbi:lethal giant larvae like, C-terminal-domain-containing protein [Xylaria bambusicola]|uniref:lethal giant larvae like, C-terminal-domain-containing protein n=1 Tax=Xylaria bambusicola TaxID=326684 RepID=UPI0020072F02|nr:lethal giant larvae like, C-terminal-domain-containing protein [Xylaria bambusicola]KAI0520873.1 lethal giant larvae like, C-terminal-domain-containing protein [Xylaria bambusicola]